MNHEFCTNPDCPCGDEEALRADRDRLAADVERLKQERDGAEKDSDIEEACDAQTAAEAVAGRRLDETIRRWAEEWSFHGSVAVADLMRASDAYRAAAGGGA